jgi:hypothetical protein
MARITLSASARQPFEISQRGDSGRRSNNAVTSRPGMPPIRNITCQPSVGTSTTPIWPVIIRPIGKISSYSRKNRPRPRALDSSLMYTAATGISPPTPMPWIRRSVTSVAKLPDSAHAMLIADISAVAPATLRTRP